MQAHTFHMPVPEEGVALEEAVERWFDASGEEVDGIMCDNCMQKLTCRKSLLITDPKNGLIVAVKRCQWNNEAKQKIKNSERIVLRR